jgi:hypothetical protein
MHFSAAYSGECTGQPGVKVNPGAAMMQEEFTQIHTESMMKQLVMGECFFQSRPIDMEYAGFSLDLGIHSTCQLISPENGQSKIAVYPFT